MKPLGANRTPSASLSAAAPAHLQSRVVRSEAERTGVEIHRFSFAPRCAVPIGVGTHWFEILV